MITTTKANLVSWSKSVSQRLQGARLEKAGYLVHLQRVRVMPSQRLMIMVEIITKKAESFLILPLKLV